MKSPVSTAVASSLIDLKLFLWLQGFYLTCCNDYQMMQLSVAMALAFYDEITQTSAVITMLQHKCIWYRFNAMLHSQVTHSGVQSIML